MKLRSLGDITEQPPPRTRGLADLLIRRAEERDIVCTSCFHRGPAPFEEERAIYAPSTLEDASTFWSYDAMARVEIRAL